MILLKLFTQFLFMFTCFFFFSYSWDLQMLCVSVRRKNQLSIFIEHFLRFLYYATNKNLPSTVFVCSLYGSSLQIRTLSLATVTLLCSRPRSCYRSWIQALAPATSSRSLPVHSYPECPVHYSLFSLFLGQEMIDSLLVSEQEKLRRSETRPVIKDTQLPACDSETIHSLAGHEALKHSFKMK